MNKTLLSTLAFMMMAMISMAQIDIADARTMSEGTEVTIQGIATNGGELGIIRYVQDATGAIAAYPGNGSTGDFPGEVNRGDLVTVTGPLKIYNGLLEIDPISAYNVISSNNMLPDPLVVTPSGVSEENEAKLLTVEDVKFDDAGGTFSVGNYGFSSGGENGEIYVRSNHPLIGSAIPFATVNITGVASQFNNIYQLLIRDSDDIEFADQFFITEAPRQSNISENGFTIEWATNAAGTSTLSYGTTSALGTDIDMGGSNTNHSINLSGLDPATIYYVQVTSNDGGQDASSNIGVFSTASLSSGLMRVYFTADVDGSYSDGDYANGFSGAAVENAIINRIEAAQTSIDVMMYNNNRETIVRALTEAHDRGVRVRYIMDDMTANLAIASEMPPFSVIKGNSAGLMHNKNFIFDAESQNNSWLISGSVNMTDGNLANDFNNALIIQDQAICRSYTLEFEEMWGSSDAMPGVFNTKFGPEKENNTPHNFMINGTLVESFFSPSDNTTSAIEGAIRSADQDLQFALLTFTRNELGTAVLEMDNTGIAVRGIIDNINDQGSEFDFLESNGVNVTPDNTTKSTHHKYCIVDATAPGSDPIVVTGSHNWSTSAEDRNDENTLLIHNASIANIFLQEFEARWCESTGQANCTTSVEDLLEVGVGFSAFPNPTIEEINVSLEVEDKADVVVTLKDINGRSLSARYLPNVKGAIVETVDMTPYVAGQYLISVWVDGKIGTQTFVKGK